MSASKDQQTKRRIRLTASGSVSAGYPRAGSVSLDLSTVLAAGGFVLRSECEEFAPFVFSADLNGADLRDCFTTGFENVDLPEFQQREGSKPFEVPAPDPVSPPSSATYEAIQFLDYEDPFAEPEPEPAFAPPAAVNQLLPVPIHFVAPPTAKLMPGTTDVPLLAATVLLPEIDLRTSRRRMSFGANPNKPKSVPAPISAPAPAPSAAPPKQTPQVVVRSSPQATITTAKPAPPVARPAAAASTAPGAAAAKRAAETSKPAAPPAVAKPAPVPEPKPAPVMAARDRGNALPVQHETEPQTIPAPVPKPKLMPIRKVEAGTGPAIASSDAAPFGLSSQFDAGGASPARKAAIAAAVFVVLGLGGYFAFGGKSANAGASADTIVDTTAPGMVLGGGGWTTTWGSDVPSNKGKQISIYRPSMAMADYRFEFRGIIERKAMGWIFRASNPKNYYVMKLETIKPGANPVVALIKYAVIDGKETTRTQVMLPLERLAIDTVYSVRLDVKGDKFTTYVQGKPVDYWTDDRIKKGGTGFYNDQSERGQIKSSQVTYLTSAAG